MSADNAIFVKYIDGTYYVREGVLSCLDEYSENWFRGGEAFETENRAYQYAEQMFENRTIVEYGIWPVEQ